MTWTSQHPWARWAVPAIAAVVAVGWASATTMIKASAEPSLPARSAATLLADVQTAQVSYGSGTVVQTADLGLPALPTIGGAGSSNLSSLVSGNHTLRLWYDGPSKVRVALMGTLGESDVIRNGRDLWTWSSDTNSATHRVLGAGAEAQTRDPAAGLTPQQVADQALAAIDPTTAVTTEGTAQVAGRNAYELVLAPKDTSSLVGQVRIAVDAQRHIPLRVQVFAKGRTTPAAEIGFTQISFTRPSAAQFTFTPPPGAKVSQASSPADQVKGQAGAMKQAPNSFAGSEPVISGTGWAAVIQAQLPADAVAGLTGGAGARRTAGSDNSLTQILGVLPRTSGSWGSGRVLHSSLFTVLLTDNGRLLAGAVPAQRLYQLAGQPLPAQPAESVQPVGPSR